MNQSRLNSWHLPDTLKTLISPFINLLFFVFIASWLFLLPQTVDAAWDSGDGVIFYAEDGQDWIRFRSWDGNNDGVDEQSGGLVSGGSDFRFIKTIVSPVDPTESHTIYRSLTLDKIYIQTCTTGDCDATGDYTVTKTINSTTTSTVRPFDIAYEETTGHAIAVYENTASSADFKYMVWDGSSWGSEQILNPTVMDDTIRFVRLESRPGTDDIALIWSDNDDVLGGYIWDGSSWVNQLGSDRCSLPLDVTFKFDAGWESDGSTLMVVCGSDTSVDWFTYEASTTTWSSAVSTNMTGFAGNMEHINVFASPYDNHIGFVGASVSTSGSVVQGSIWNGSSWTKNGSAFTSSGRGVSGATPAEGAWIDEDTAVFVWGVTGRDYVNYAVWEDGVGFGAPKIETVKTATNNHWDTTRVYSPTDSNQIIVLSLDASNDINMFTATSCTTSLGCTWQDEGTLTETAPDSIYQMMDFAFYAPSTSSITVSGTIYQADGVSAYNCSDNNLTVRVKSNGAGDYSTTCTVLGGTYTVAGVAVTPNSPIVVYLDGETVDANTITITDGSTNITGADLYQGHVIVKHDTGSSITNANLDSYDSGNEGDGDILYSVTSNNLTVTGVNLLVWAGDTFAPGGNITTSTSGDLIVNGTLNAGGNILTAGNVIVNSGGTLALNTRNLTVNGGSITGAGTITSTTNSNSGITYTTDYTTTVNGSGSIGGGDYSFAHLKLGTSSAGTTIAAGSFTVKNKLTIESGHIFDASDDTITLGGVGSTFVNNGTLYENTSTFVYHGAGMYAQPETYYNLTLLPTSSAPFSELYPLVGTFNVTNNLVVGDGVVNGTVRNDVNDPIFNVDGNVTINNLVGLTMSDGGQAFNVAGSWTNSASATFTHSNGTVTFDGSGTQTINTGGDSFYNATFSGSATYELGADATVDNNFNLTSGNFSPESYTLTVKNLNISGTGDLQLISSGDTVEIETAFAMSGGELTTENLGIAPKITTNGEVGTNHFSVNITGGTLGVNELTFESVDDSGIVFGDGESVTITNFNNIILSSFEDGAASVLLDITDQSKVFNNVTFPNAGSYTQGVDFNVRINDVDGVADTITILGYSGTFAGEAYDSDNGNDIVDWGVSISLSGTLYSDAGSTVVNCSEENRSIAVSINGATPTTGTCSAVGGTFTVTGLVAEVNDIITVFVDGHDNDASTVLKNNNTETDITGLDLYEGHVIIRDDVGSGMDVDDLAGYDSDDQAGDLEFTAVSADNSLTVNDDNTLYIWNGDTFAPGGNMTLDSIIIGTGSTLTNSGGEAHTISGSWTNNGTFTSSTATVYFDSIDADETITSGGSSFYNLITNGSGTWTALDTLTITNALSVYDGTLDLDDENAIIGTAAGSGTIFDFSAGSISQTSGTTTLQGSGFLAQSGGTFQFANLALGDDSHTKSTTLSGTVSVTGNLTVNDKHTMSGTGSMTVNGDVTGAGTITLTGGTFEQRVAQTENFGTSAGSTNWTFNNLTFSRSGGTAVIDTDTTGSGDITITGTLKVSKTGDEAATTLQAGDRTWNITNTGGLKKPFTLDEASGVLTAEDSTFVIGGVYGTTSDADAVTLENATYKNLTVGTGSTEKYDAENTMSVTGDLVVATNAIIIGTDNWTVNGSVTGGGAFSLSSGTFLQRVAEGESFGATGGTGGSWTFSNLTFENSSLAAVVITSPSGGSGAIVPNGTLTIGNATDSATTALDLDTNDRNVDVNNVTITANGILDASSGATFTVSGNWINSGDLDHNNGTITFDGTGSKTISGNLTGTNAFYNITFNNASGSWGTGTGGTESLTADNNFTITAGTFTAPGTSWATNILRVGGNFSNDPTNGVFVHNNGRLEFIATDTDNTVNMGGDQVNYLWFNGTGGEWLVTGPDFTTDYFVIQNGTVDADVDMITVTSGMGGYLTEVGTLNVTYDSTFDWRRSTTGSFGSANFYTGWTYNNLILSNSSVSSNITLTSGWKVGSDITITGTLQVGRDTDTYATNVVLDDENYIFSGTTPFALASSPAGTLNTGTSNVKLTGSGTVNIIDGVDFYNLETDGDGTYTFASGSTNVANNMTITSGTVDLNSNDNSLSIDGNLIIGGSLTASNTADLTVSGDWTNNGTFTHSNGNVVLDTNTEADVAGSSSTDFYDLTIGTQGKTVRFKKAQTVGVAGTFTAEGDVRDKIVIKSDSETVADSADQFLFNLTGNTNLNWIVVINGGCYSGPPQSSSVPTNPYMFNGGNNNSACWPFVDIGVTYQFAPGDGAGGGTPVTGGGNGGGSSGGDTGDIDGDGDGGGGAETGGDSSGGGGEPSP